MIEKTLLSKTVTHRRHLHQNPELSGSEYNTANYVYENLKQIGLKPRYMVGKRAVVADIPGASSQIIALRADMDALPILENSEEEFPFIIIRE